MLFFFFILTYTPQHGQLEHIGKKRRRRGTIRGENTVKNIYTYNMPCTTRDSLIEKKTEKIKNSSDQ